jgi:hypothetical protein
MFQEPEVPVSRQLVESGLAGALGDDEAERFIAAAGLSVVFATGGRSVRREAHDVAVALRELLKDYRGQLRAAVIEGEPTAAQREMLRISATPCITLAVGGEVLEALPHVRDWADYHAVFQRYLGTPDRITNLLESA